ncbi:magnesium transporter [Parachlamydia acanthamoebae]|uniref:magnesium transporter n=1 Tax=Parachlamydia acanthamoebae TaxID=83552 RepID=UPI0009AE8E84|nr:CBS domain-containing protein [Parachlamydia acanthamoebae]
MYEAFDIEHLKELIRLHNQPEIEQTIKTCLPADLADLLSDLSEKDQKYFFEILPSDVATKVFEFLDPSTQLEILKLLSASEVSNLLNAIAPDDRTAFLEKLPPKSLNEYLRLLSPPEQSVALKLLGYPENSVGRLMTPDFLAVRKEWSVKQVLDYIRAYGHDSETINLIYVVDEKGKLLDDIKIKEFLFVSPTYKVSDLMDNSFIALNVTDDQEVAVNSFKKNNRGALPVIDSHGILKGIVTIDDVLFVAEEEDTEDIQKIGGVEALEDPYMESPLLLLIRKRAFWLVILFVGELFTASAMAFFEEDIAKAHVNPTTSGQQELHRTHAIKLKETWKQLAKFIALTEFNDVKPVNIPLVPEKKGFEDPSRIALVDLEHMESAVDGFCGSYNKSNGLLSCIPAEQIKDIVKEANKHGITLSKKLVRAIEKDRLQEIEHHKKVREFHEKKGI